MEFRFFPFISAFRASRSSMRLLPKSLPGGLRGFVSSGICTVSVSASVGSNHPKQRDRRLPNLTVDPAEQSATWTSARSFSTRVQDACARRASTPTIISATTRCRTKTHPGAAPTRWREFCSSPLIAEPTTFVHLLPTAPGHEMPRSAR